MSKKKLTILTIIAIIVICIIGYFIYKINIGKNSIKEGDIFNNVSFKNDIPKINSKDALIKIFDSENNIDYWIIYNGNDVTNKGTENITIIVEERENIKNTNRYRYSWDNFDIPLTTIATPKGWSILQKTNNGQDYLMPIQNIPISSINGIVEYTSGNTSIFKKILIGL